MSVSSAEFIEDVNSVSAHADATSSLMLNVVTHRIPSSSLMASRR